MSSLGGGRDRLELLGEGRGGDQEEGVRSLDREMGEREGEGELLRFFLSLTLCCSSLRSRGNLVNTYCRDGLIAKSGRS